MCDEGAGEPTGGRGGPATVEDMTGSIGPIEGEAEEAAEAATPAPTLARWQLARRLAYPAEVPERMERMARVHGVELARAGLDRATLIAMIGRCGACGAFLDCAEALSEARTVPEGCAFCPNAEVFRDVAQRLGERG